MYNDNIADQLNKIEADAIDFLRNSGLPMTAQNMDRAKSVLSGKMPLTDEQPQASTEEMILRGVPLDTAANQPTAPVNNVPTTPRVSQPKTATQPSAVPSSQAPMPVVNETTPPPTSANIVDQIVGPQEAYGPPVQQSQVTPAPPQVPVQQPQAQTPAPTAYHQAGREIEATILGIINDLTNPKPVPQWQQVSPPPDPRAARDIISRVLSLQSPTISPATIPAREDIVRSIIGQNNDNALQKWSYRNSETPKL